MVGHKIFLLILFGAFILNEVGSFKLNRQKEVLESNDPKKQASLQIDYVGTHTSFSYGSHYTIPIGASSLDQPFNVYIDMKSGDTWLADLYCQSLTNGCVKFCRTDCKKKFGCEECCSATYYPCNVKDKYESLISSTFKNLSTFWDPDAEYSGYYGQETIAFGSWGDVDFIEIPNSNVEFATFIAENAIDGNYSDGSFGLAFSKKSTSGKMTVWENAFQQQIFAQSLFTITLEKEDPHLQGHYAGILNFGSLDSCTTRTIQYFDLVKDSGYWQFMFEQTLFNEEPLSGLGNYRAIVDINEVMIRVPSAEFKTIVTKTGAIYNFDYNIYTVDCDTHFSWAFKFGDKNVELDSKNLLKRNKVLETCVLPFDLQSELSVDYVLGSPIMKHYCSVFDYGNSRIGFGYPKSAGHKL